MKTGEIKDVSDKRRSEAVEWLNSLSLNFKNPFEVSDDEFRARLLDGTVLACILNTISPGLAEESSRDFCGSSQWAAYFKCFRSVMEEMGLPVFSLVDLQRGSMGSVVECILSLRDYLSDENCRADRIQCVNRVSRRLCVNGSIGSDESSSELMMSNKFSPFSAGHDFRELFHAKEGNVDVCATRISELTKLADINNAPTMSLLRFIHGIVDECIENKNGEKHQPVRRILNSVLQELSRRISTQTEQIRNQNILIKSREMKYQSRIKVLETLTNVPTEATMVIMNQLQLTETEKTKIEEQKNIAEKDVVRLTEDKGHLENIISSLKSELKTTKDVYEHRYMELQNELKETKQQLRTKEKDIEVVQEHSRKKISELEQALESKCETWSRNEDKLRDFACSELLTVQELRKTSKSLKEEVLKTRLVWQNHLDELGIFMKAVGNAESRRIEKQDSIGANTDYTAKTISVPEKSSEFSELNSRSNSGHSSHSLRKLFQEDKIQYLTDADSEERSSNVSDSSFSVGTETDGSFTENDLEIFLQSGIPKEKKSISRFLKKFMKKGDDATSTKQKSSDVLNSKSSKSGASKQKILQQKPQN